jgi:hypothetical protein
MTTSGASDFDFFFGAWTVAHRRLKERLTGCTDWETFGGACTTWPILGGLGNVDDNLLHLPAGEYRAVTMRSFDVATGQWAIWWLDGRTPHTLDVPVKGGFQKGVGTFYADDMLDGRPIRVRFEWSRTNTPSPRWEQAFSADAGATWEPNWTMDFSRATV